MLTRTTIGVALLMLSELLSSSANANAQGIAPAMEMLGVNQAGGEFGRTPGEFHKDYTYPGAEQFDYCQQKGLRIVRLPFRWERIQPKLMQALDGKELDRLNKVAELAGERQLTLILDMHNYARYNGKVVGTPDVPNAALADAWRRLATHFSDNRAIVAYGVMNEPHGTKGLWPAAAQAAVDAIREVDTKTTISMCGEGYSGAHSWRKHNEKFLLNDPANRLVYEAHQYFDHNNSGSYKRSYEGEKAYPTIGVKRLQPFIDWLSEHDQRGFIGEFGVPDNDPRWLVVLDNFLAEMQQHNLGGAYWAAGPWWNNYSLSIEPEGDQDRPQMAVLEYYLNADQPNRTKPWIAAAETAEMAAERARQLDTKLGRRIHDFTYRAESYHYKNKTSEYASTAGQDAQRKVRKIAFKHQGNPAYVGVGLYFGALKGENHQAFHLELRAEKPVTLEVKAVDTTGKKFTGKFKVGSEWQLLRIPFDELTAGESSYAGGQAIEKLELQPSPNYSGNTLYLGPLRLTPRP